MSALIFFVIGKLLHLISQLNDEIGVLTNTKLTLVEYKATTSGNSLTFDTSLSSDTNYLISIQGPESASGRRLRLSLINAVSSYATLNEVYIGHSSFTLTIDASRHVTISASDLRYGIVVSLIKLS